MRIPFEMFSSTIKKTVSLDTLTCQRPVQLYLRSVIQGCQG
ncbi:unnamed protein product [Ixodes pacificus]